MHKGSIVCVAIAHLGNSKSALYSVCLALFLGLAPIARGEPAKRNRSRKHIELLYYTSKVPLLGRDAKRGTGAKREALYPPSSRAGA